MVSEAARRTRRAHVEREGELATVRTYEFGTEDRHGDAPETQTANSPYRDVPVRYKLIGSQATRVGGIEGEELTYSVRVDLRDDAAPVTDGVLAGAAEDRPASEIDIDGQTFRVVRRLDDDKGLVRLNCAHA